jgi:hypothetical protein
MKPIQPWLFTLQILARRSGETMSPARKARATKTRSAKVKKLASTREWSRISSLKDISLVYEGQSDVLVVRTPDISPRGMFINTAAIFAEGAVLKVRFRLAQSNFPIQVRAEVRYCLPSVGVGVEFIGIAPRDEKAIRDEIAASAKTRPTKKHRK